MHIKLNRAIHGALAALLLAGAAGALAEPAPYYQWRSLADGTIVCSQTSLGEGWERTRGPFQDARCKKPGKVNNQF